MSVMDRVKMAVLKELLSQGGKCQGSVTEIYRKLRQNLPTIVLIESEEALRNMLKTCDKMFQMSSDDQIVSPITELTICTRHCKRSGSCTSTRCRDLHLCVFFVLSGKCLHAERCHFGHDLTTAHNRNVLQEHRLQDLNLTELRTLLCLPTVRQGALVPNICTYYNDHHGCSKSDSCKAFHICRFYLSQSCKFGTKCNRNHDIQNAQVSKVLSMYGISTARPVTQVLEELRSLPLNKPATRRTSNDGSFDDLSAASDDVSEYRIDDEGDDLSEGEVRSRHGKEGNCSLRQPDRDGDRDPLSSSPGQGQEGWQTDRPEEVLVLPNVRSRRRQNIGQNHLTGPGMVQKRKTSKRRRHSFSPASDRGHSFPFDARICPTSIDFNESNVANADQQNAGLRNGSNSNGWNDQSPHHGDATDLYVNNYFPSNEFYLDDRGFSNPVQTNRSPLYDPNGSSASHRNGSPFYDRSNITPRCRSRSPNSWRADNGQNNREPLLFASRDESCFAHRNDPQEHGWDDTMARCSSRSSEPPHSRRLGRLEDREESSSPRPRRKKHRRVYVVCQDEADDRNFETRASPLHEDNTQRYRDRKYSGSSLRTFQDDGAEKIDATNHFSFGSFYRSESPSDSARRGQSPDWGRRGLSPDVGRRGQSPDGSRRGQSPDGGRRGQSPDVGQRGQSPDWGRGSAPGPCKIGGWRGRGGYHLSGRANRGRPNRIPGGDTNLQKFRRGRSPFSGSRPAGDISSPGGETGSERFQRRRSPHSGSSPTRDVFSHQATTSSPQSEIRAHLPWGSGVQEASSGRQKKLEAQSQAGGSLRLARGSTTGRSKAKRKGK